MNWVAAVTATIGTGALGAAQSGLIQGKAAGWVALGALMLNAFQGSIFSGKASANTVSNGTK